MNLQIEEELKVNQRHQKWYSNIQYPLKTLSMFHAYPNFSSTPYEKWKLDWFIKRRAEEKKRGGIIEKFAVLISTCRRIELLFGRNKGIPNNFASRSDTFNREIFSCPGAKGVLRFHKITCALDLFSRSSQRCLAPRSLPVTNKRSLRC